MNSNPALGLLGFWMMMQLAATLAILLGGIYALFCLGRAASGLDRLASAMEDWVARQEQSTPSLPGAPTSKLNLQAPSHLSSQLPPISQAAPTVQTQTFVPPVTPPSATIPSTSTEYSHRDEPST